MAGEAAGRRRTDRGILRDRPGIVHAMKDSLNYGELCEEILSRYIRPCLALIAEGRNEECKRLYIEMVRYSEGLVSQAA